MGDSLDSERLKHVLRLLDRVKKKFRCPPADSASFLRPLHSKHNCLFMALQKWCREPSTEERLREVYGVLYGFIQHIALNPFALEKILTSEDEEDQEHWASLVKTSRALECGIFKNHGDGSSRVGFFLLPYLTPSEVRDEARTIRDECMTPPFDDAAATALLSDNLTSCDKLFCLFSAKPQTKKGKDGQRAGATALGKLDATKRTMALKALEKTCGNVVAAASLLKITRSELNHMIAKYALRDKLKEIREQAGN